MLDDVWWNTWLESGISHRIVSLRMSYIMNLTYIVKAAKFEMWISGQQCELAKKCSCMTFIEVDICHLILVQILKTLIRCHISLLVQSKSLVETGRRRWMGSLWLVYSMTLTFIFKVKHFLVMQLLWRKLCRQWMFPADLPWLACLHCGVALVYIPNYICILINIWENKYKICIIHFDCRLLWKFLAQNFLAEFLYGVLLVAILTMFSPSGREFNSLQKR